MSKAEPKQTVVRIGGVLFITQMSRSMIYQLIKEGLFPKPIKLGSRASAWITEEVEKWLEDRIKARDEGMTK